MLIKRDTYLKKLISVQHNGMIKVITGIRRCGKSFLLSTIYTDWLKEHGVDAAHIIHINLENRRNISLRNPDNLLAYIDSMIKDDAMHYIMIDEIQHVPEFEDVLNSYLGMSNVDVYVTGSNARFLSKDVVTTFRGRGFQIRVNPLSFSEYLPASGLDKEDGLMEYMYYGGLPQVVFLKENEEKIYFLKDLFAQTYIRDIVERYRIKNTEMLDELLNILASGIGALTNPGKLANTFESIHHEKINRTTLANYLEYLRDAFIVERAERYDIKGKKYIDSPYKYYFTDIGLRNARLNFRQIERSHIMENLIYNELIFRGFTVDVGVVPVQTMTDGMRKRSQLEVDFVCNKGYDRYYIQSALEMPTEEKIRQEMASLRNIDDSFKKIVVVGTHQPLYHNHDGFTIISIYDFLLKDNSLEL
ncbi:MAG: ATP-binding protein [Muribaculaceae bacterium]|nr:ATP-binding protein [Muribaculaceae bacterium]